MFGLDPKAIAAAEAIAVRLATALERHAASLERHAASLERVAAAGDQPEH